MKLSGCGLAALTQHVIRHQATLKLMTFSKVASKALKQCLCFWGGISKSRPPFSIGLVNSPSRKLLIGVDEHRQATRLIGRGLSHRVKIGLKEACSGFRIAGGGYHGLGEGRGLGAWSRSRSRTQRTHPAIGAAGVVSWAIMTWDVGSAVLFSTQLTYCRWEAGSESGRQRLRKLLFRSAL